MRRTKYNDSVRHGEIQKSNNRLLHKLIEISKRDASGTYFKTKSSEDPMLHHKQFYIRKNTALKIANENERIAERIMKQEPSMKKKELDEKYEDLRLIKDRLQRFQYQQEYAQKIRNKDFG